MEPRVQRQGYSRRNRDLYRKRRITLPPVQDPRQKESSTAPLVIGLGTSRGANAGLRERMRAEKAAADAKRQAKRTMLWADSLCLPGYGEPIRPRQTAGYRVGPEAPVMGRSGFWYSFR